MSLSSQCRYYIFPCFRECDHEVVCSKVSCFKCVHVLYNFPFSKCSDLFHIMNTMFSEDLLKDCPEKMFCFIFCLTPFLFH